MRETASNVIRGAIGVTLGAANRGISILDDARRRLTGDVHPDVEADAGHRSPPEEDLSKDPAYEPPGHLKDLKGG